MTGQTREDSVSDRRLDRGPLPFAVALGHRLRQLREANGDTAADIASRSRIVGLNWDRSTVARIELGQRQVTAQELLMMPFTYKASVRDCLPTEPSRLTEKVTSDARGLRDALIEAEPDGLHVEGLVELVGEAIETLRPKLRALQDRLPGANIVWMAEAAAHVKEEATLKAAQRLEATPEEVAVAAEMLWERGLAAERDARVDAMGPVPNARARQARRGHVTRVLLTELVPAIEAVRTPPSADDQEHGNG